MDLRAPRPRRVGDHERVPAVGLGLTRIQIRSTAHHQTGHIRDRHLAAGGDSDRQLGNRPGLVDHQPSSPVTTGLVDQFVERGLVVADRPGEQRLAVVVEDNGEVLLLADIETDPHGHFVG